MGDLKLFHTWYATIAVRLLVYILINGTQDIPVEGKSCQCLANWVDFGDYCYRFMNDTIPFQAAQDRCNSFSRGSRTAQVATVLSEEENEFLGEYVAGLVGRTIGLWISMKLTMKLSVTLYGLMDQRLNIQIGSRVFQIPQKWHALNED